MTTRRILVTSSLPNANDPIHVGQLFEYIQADIWVRFQKLRGHGCLQICADDTHGTAIVIRARQEGRSEEELIAEMKRQHERDFAGFDIVFDNYGSTNSPKNLAACEQIWAGLRHAGLVREKETTRLYDPQADVFLTGQFVRGTCPNCKAPNQYGNNCDKCGASYGATNLIAPVSTLSGAAPELRQAKHLFVELEQLHAFLEEWTQRGSHLQTEVANYLRRHFLGEPLRDLGISRPAPYFGFQIPDSPGKYWCAQFDAPIGYIASTWDWCERYGERLDDWWRSDDTEVHHFIGKDLTCSHTLLWIGILKVAGFTLPTRINVLGFVSIGDGKMAGRKSMLIPAETYLKHLDPSYLRYYYASKLGPRPDDVVLNLDEFVTKVNADLVGKVINLASRIAKFVQGARLSPVYPNDGGLFTHAAAAGSEIADAYEMCDFSRAIRLVMELAARANSYVESARPWSLRKNPAKVQQLKDVCTVTLNLFRQLAVYLAPVLPRLAEQTGSLLGGPLVDWNQSQTPLVGTPVGPFQHMLRRVASKDVLTMIEDC